MADIDNRICKMCLLKDYYPEKYKETLEEYINRIKPEEKASENEYNRRLDICKDCEKLSQGTCLRCGCYVELRAASKNAHCPGKSW